MNADRRTIGILFQAAAWLDRLLTVDIDTSEGAKATEEGKDIIEQLDQWIPDWRDHQPPRTKEQRIVRSAEMRARYKEEREKQAG